MAVSRDEFFAELDTLTDQEIEQRLPLLDREQLLLVQQYIDRRGDEPKDQVPRPQNDSSKVSEPSSDSRIATLAALITARKAMSMAVAALILSIGAMLTAIVAGVIAYLMLPH